MSQMTKRVLRTRRPRACAARRRRDRPGRRPPAAKLNRRARPTDAWTRCANHGEFGKDAFGQATACV